MAAYTLTIKQRAFADRIIAGDTQTVAYRAAYKAENMSAAAVSVQASRLANHPNVSLYIAEKREQVETLMVETVAFDAKRALEMALEDRQKAHDRGQSGAAVSATRLACDIRGIVVERKEVKLDGGWDEVLAVVGKTPRGLPDESIH